MISELNGLCIPHGGISNGGEIHVHDEQVPQMSAVNCGSSLTRTRMECLSFYINLLLLLIEGNFK